MKAVTLMYHDVCDDPETSGFPGGDADLYKVSLAQFNAHLGVMDNLSSSKPISVEKWEQSDRNIPIFLTFDDGGKSAIKAADILDERGWIGHFFITTGRIGSSGFVDKADIAELDRRGHVIGSHSNSHPLRMGALSKPEIQKEWQQSVGILSDILSKQIRTASVPGGFFSAVVRDEAFAAGIRFLFNSEPSIRVSARRENVVLGRYSVTAGMSERDVAGLITGNDMSRIKQSLIWSIKKPIKKIGGESFLKIRKAIMDR